MSTSQGDPKSKTQMASHAPPEMKMQDRKDDYKEGVLINQEMDDQPYRGKRKHDEEDDQKAAAKPKKDIPENDEENQDDYHPLIKKQSRKNTLRKCFTDISKHNLDHMMTVKDQASIPL